MARPVMQLHQDPAKLELLAQVSKRVDDGIDTDQDTRNFTQQLFARVSLEELEQTPAGILAAISANMAEYFRYRRPGQALVRVYNPEEDKHGWTSPHTVVELITDDMPFLVDSASLAVTEMGLTIHMIVHPVIWVSRDPAGELVQLLERGAEEGKPEALMHVQVDRCVERKQLERLRNRVEQTLEDVRLAVEDWRPMQKRTREVAAQLPDLIGDVDPDHLEEAQAFLEWLANDHFTFLGFREYEVVDADGEREMHIVESSGLGILRKITEDHKPRKLRSLSQGALQTETKPEPVLVTKTNARSTVHRSGYMDYIGVLSYDGAGRVIGEFRILGLFTSGAYNRRCIDTPLLRRKVNTVLERSGLRLVSHEGKALLHIMETLPRDEVFQSNPDQLFELATGILDLRERPHTRLFVRRERFGRFYSCLVFIPRDRFNTENRRKIQAILKRGLKGEHLDFAVQVSESNLARLHVTIRPKRGVQPDIDIAALEKRIVNAVRSWHEDLKQTLIQRHGERRGLELSDQFGNVFPVSYMDEVSPWVASFDVDNAVALSHPNDLRTSLYRPRKRRLKYLLRFKLFKYGDPLHLSSILPILEDLGLKVVNERPYQLVLKDGDKLWIQDFDVLPAQNKMPDLDVSGKPLKEAFSRVWQGDLESDGFNRLILHTGLRWRQVALVRAYCRYLLQTRLPFSQAYMEQAVNRYPRLTRLLIGLLEVTFAPDQRSLRKALQYLRYDLQIDTEAECGGESACLQIREAIRGEMTEVHGQDDDRIMRALVELAQATVRTNYFCHGETESYPDYLCFKIDSGRVSELPRPKPYREIWVYSPRVEGIHLRGGPVARGGLRWSDRREDFRTEVLGLMKAQNVKNTMIVPVGAKGGFVVRKPPEEDREALMAEAMHCYRSFIHGLLDITDNLVDGEIVSPSRVKRLDDDDAYLVVAADKGTASFSDIANSIAEEHGFWLGDAFASGGSHGYDHKKMGITAKGAWESVKRHFRELGLDTQSEPFTVVGIGDMAGDVFGNGMLLSPHIKLQAAFNHMHIFIDPDPDPSIGYKERQRLFELERSTWEDYEESLISKGGGVWSRKAKHIDLSSEVREWLGLESESLTPQELIRQLLRAPADLLWNGGIGTYVKASSESHVDVGDRANDAVRVDGCELRCRVVGEGGNLGLTQAARVEYALNGGRVNADFIDNSAGVDCSDHEVNIKILLDLVGREQGLGFDTRNDLLERMTGEVESLVLRSNYLQNQALSQMQRLAVDRLGATMHLIASLEGSGYLDRKLEGLPDNDTIQERAVHGLGLTRPELAVLLSYSKIALYQELLGSGVPEDSYLRLDLAGYFPQPLQDAYEEVMERHPLRREIIATSVTNSMVNRMGASFVTRVREDTGADNAAIAKAYTIAREVFESRRFWREIEMLDGKVAAAVQLDALHEMWDVVRHATRWLLNRPGVGRLDIQQQVSRFAPGIHELREVLDTVIPESQRGNYEQTRDHYRDAGFPDALARETALLRFTHVGLDIVDEASCQELPVPDVLSTYFRVGEALDIGWLREQIETLSTHGTWDAHARGHLRNDLTTQHRALTNLALRMCASDRDGDSVDTWLDIHREPIERARQLFGEMRNLPAMDLASATVAVRSLAQLVTACE